MHHIYCISGLGADERIFEKLHIENAELHFIKWEVPARNDSMRTYALKLAKQIKHDQIILLGMSYGGMLATEIGNQMNMAAKSASKTPIKKHIDIIKTIIVSSCKNSHELPNWLRRAGKMNIHKLMPYGLLLRYQMFNRIVIGFKVREEELHLKRMMLHKSNLAFIKKSLNIILKWNSDYEASNGLVHIHGTKDRLFTPHHVHANHWVKGGGHFMIWNKAKEISALINGIINTEHA